MTRKSGKWQCSADLWTFDHGFLFGAYIPIIPKPGFGHILLNGQHWSALVDQKYFCWKVDFLSILTHFLPCIYLTENSLRSILSKFGTIRGSILFPDILTKNMPILGGSLTPSVHTEFYRDQKICSRYLWGVWRSDLSNASTLMVIRLINLRRCKSHKTYIFFWFFGKNRLEISIFFTWILPIFGKVADFKSF